MMWCASKDRTRAAISFYDSPPPPAPLPLPPPFPHLDLATFSISSSHAIRAVGRREKFFSGILLHIFGKEEEEEVAIDVVLLKLPLSPSSLPPSKRRPPPNSQFSAVSPPLLLSPSKKLSFGFSNKKKIGKVAALSTTLLFSPPLSSPKLFYDLCPPLFPPPLALPLPFPLFLALICQTRCSFTLFRSVLLFLRRKLCSPPVPPPTQRRTKKKGVDDREKERKKKTEQKFLFCTAVSCNTVRQFLSDCTWPKVSAVWDFLIYVGGRGAYF